MSCWLTSQNKKRHQRAINKLVRVINHKFEHDDLWRGRFIVQQIESPEWCRYGDGFGAEYWVCLKFIDRATGKSYVKWGSVNYWRGLHGNGWRIWKLMNWLITEHWQVWNEPMAADRNYEVWKEYNQTTRKV